MRKKFNLPNTLTLIRILLTPVFLFLFLNKNIPNHFLWGLIVFAVGSFTDFLDGKIARARQLITVFGQLADPVADKVLTTAALLAFMDLGFCSIWIVMIVLLREFTVTSFRLVATSQGVVIPANIYGKLKTVSQMVFSLVIMLLAHLADVGKLAADFPLATVSNALLGVTCALCVISGAIYLAKSYKLIDFSK